MRPRSRLGPLSLSHRIGTRFDTHTRHTPTMPNPAITNLMVSLGAMQVSSFEPFAPPLVPRLVFARDSSASV